MSVQLEKITQLSSLKKQYEEYSERLANLYAKQERRTIERYYKTRDSVKKRKTVAGMFTYKEDTLWTEKIPDLNTISARAAKLFPTQSVSSYFSLDNIMNTNDAYSPNILDEEIPDMEATNQKFEKTLASHLTKRRKLNEEEENYREYQEWIMTPISIDTSQYFFLGDQYANEYIATESGFSFFDSSMFMESHWNFKDVMDDDPILTKSTKTKVIERVKKPEVPKFETFRSGWSHLIKNELPQGYESYCKTYLRRRNQLKKLCDSCQQKRITDYTSSLSNPRDISLRTKKYLKEILTYQRKIEKDERESKKKTEKELQEKRKKESEIRELQRQDNKISFLLNQTELFSHLMEKKISKNSNTSSVPGIQDNEAVTRTMAAVDKHYQLISKFEEQIDEIRGGKRPHLMSNGDVAPVPMIFHGNLKTYQVEGFRWLVNLYEQGINGILADEMGLGKTIQTIAFLSYLAEVKDVWGPFLIIAPLSTLHNWCSEISKFCPSLKVLPYWGTQKERATLRQLWDPKHLYSQNSPFHIVVSSSNLVMFDEKYLHQIKWQYIILDEAQALKSFTTIRWKTFSTFSCRNRLLLTGASLQNSMQELWNLLNFIMPTLFDSHSDFQDWFAKDIENHVGQAMLNERQLSRLHTILKPFMLRRIKKDVEQEIAEKIEIELPCTLTTKQNLYYSKLKNKINIRDLAEKSQNNPESSLNLVNLVMQFRKVCNHPELFHRADIYTPYSFSTIPSYTITNYHPIISKLKNPICYNLPRLVFEECNFDRDIKIDIWSASNIDGGLSSNSTFSFIKMTNLTPSQLSMFATKNIFQIWQEYCILKEQEEWRDLYSEKLGLLPKSLIISPKIKIKTSKVILSNFVRDPLDLMQDFKWMFKRCLVTPKAYASAIDYYCNSSRFNISIIQHEQNSPQCKAVLLGKSLKRDDTGNGYLTPIYSTYGGSPASIPEFNNLVTDSGKLQVLDKLLNQLRSEGHRCLIYSQMTKMIDILEEFMMYRKYKYIRLDGTSKLSERRDLVDDFQSKPDIFVFLLSTKAGGAGINLTAADTVIFFDSDWNPTNDQLAMDRAHRLGQTKQVTVYRLLTQGTVEERMLRRAKQKNEMQSIVISGGVIKGEEKMTTQEALGILLDEEDVQQQQHGTNGIAPNNQPLKKRGRKPKV